MPTYRVKHLVEPATEFLRGGGRKGLAGFDTTAGAWRVQIDDAGTIRYAAMRGGAETFSSVTITGHAGTGNRMVQAGPDGTYSAVDAPTARTTLGAQAALGYTPVNKSGDAMTGGLVMPQATVQDISDSQVVSAKTGGRLAGDNGFSVARDAGNRTYRINLGLGSTNAAELRMYAPAGGSPARSLFIDGVQRFQDWTTASGSWMTRLYDAAGAGLYYPIWAEAAKITLGVGGSIPVHVPNRMISNTELACVKALGTTRDAASKWTLYNNDERYGASGWVNSTNDLIIAFLMGAGVWTDRYKFGNNGDLDLLSGNFKLAGTQRISNGGDAAFTTLGTTGLATLNSLKVTGQAGTGNRLVQAGPDGTYSAVDAPTARTTLGAQAALGYTPVNKSGDEMNVDAGLRIQSSGGPTSGFISKSTTGDLREVQLANGLLIFRNPSFAGSLPFASLEPDGRVLFNHPGGGYWEFGGGDLNMSLGRQLRAYGVPVVGTRKTGWTAPTGTATRSTFATGSVTLPQLAERVKALIDDLISHGLIGA